MNSLSLVWSRLTSTHSILYYGHITCDLRPLLQKCIWGIKQGLGTVTCNTLFISDYWSCMCVFLSYSSLFQSDLLPHLQSLWSIHACALCFWVPLGGTWEHKALGWMGCKLWRWGNTFPCWVHYCEFLEFFQFGENTQWIMDGFAVGRMCARSVDIDHFCTKAPWV